MTRLATARLLLRPACPADLADLHAVLSDPRAMRYWSTLPHTELAQSAAWMQSMIDARDATLDFVIEHEGRVIGKAGCWRGAELGFILQSDRWGRGLAHEALVAVIAHVFAGTDLPALEADVDPRNAASLRLLARLGFRETGRAERTFQLGDAWCDSVYLRLDRPTQYSPAQNNPVT